MQASDARIPACSADRPECRSLPDAIPASIVIHYGFDRKPVFVLSLRSGYGGVNAVVQKESGVSEDAGAPGERGVPRWDFGRRPVHPPLVHAPVGGVIIAAVCDVVSAASDGHSWSRSWFQTGSYALIVGTAIMVITVATGFIERSRRTGARTRERAAVNRHAVVMGLLAVVCVVDLILRINLYSAVTRTPVAALVLTLVALVLTVVGGELGGRLAYRLGIGVGGRRG
jgi:uncharacterized membrane protein